MTHHNTPLFVYIGHAFAITLACCAMTLLWVATP